MNKNKEETTLAEASDKQMKKKGRLDGMLESMDKRSDPVTTHRVATEYFQSFRDQRNINKYEEKLEDKIPTAVTTGVGTAVVDDTQLKNTINHIVTGEGYNTVLTHNKSETKVYNAIKYELEKNNVKEMRIGLKKLQKLTGLSDKTIRVSTHSLEKKKSIIIVESSKGIYGRKFFLPRLKDVLKERLLEGIEIDKVTKTIYYNTAVTTAVD